VQNIFKQNEQHKTTIASINQLKKYNKKKTIKTTTKKKT
jgi:hypothetical protein